MKSLYLEAKVSSIADQNLWCCEFGTKPNCHKRFSNV